jgi:hypothetical protein
VPTAPSAHKKIVFGAMGCAAALAVVSVIGWISMRRLGLETFGGPALTTPRAAAAALDSLSRLDLSSPIAAGVGPAIDCADSDDARRVAPASAGEGDVRLAFGDTFPPASAHYRLWVSLGAAVRLEDSSEPAGRPDTARLPSGPTLLAGIRWYLDRDDPSGACIVLATLLRRARVLQSGHDLRAITAGAQVERDAMSMVSRHSGLGAADTLRVAAAARVADLDRRLPAWRSLQQLVDAAGTSPTGVDRLADWALDPTLALPLRDALVRAVGFGWVFDPQEGGVQVEGSRRDAVARLTAGLPEPLRSTADSARAAITSDLPARFRFAVVYRAHRDTPSW